MTINTIWRDRWMYSLEPAIMQSREKIEEQVKKNKEISLQTREALTTIATTLEGLRRFAAGQTRFFRDLFYKTPEVLEADPIRYPKEWVMRTTFNQVAFDLEVLQRAANQRLWSINGSASAKTLQLADQYAYHHILHPAIEAGYLKETAVITYFQKSPFVRVIPYAPVALIGIPYTTINVSRDNSSRFPVLGEEPYMKSFGILDFAAIAHEVGHYVYHHGVIPKQKEGEKQLGVKQVCEKFVTELQEEKIETDDLENKLKAIFIEEKGELKKCIDPQPQNRRQEAKSLPQPRFANLVKEIRKGKVSRLHKWSEEIFADIYGCLVAGPLIAFTFIDLQIDNNPRFITSRDTQHPPVILRPHIYLSVLEDMNCQEDMAVLNKLWSAWLQERGISVPDPNSYILKSIKTFIKSIMQKTKLTEVKSMTNWPGQKLCGNLSQISGNDFEGTFREVAFKLRAPLQEELNIRGYPYEYVPYLKISNECFHEQPCTWELIFKGKQKRGKGEGHFWYNGGGSKTKIESLNAPLSAPGIQVLMAYAAGKWDNSLIPSECWKHVFLMNGWNTGGPEEDGSN